MSKENKFTAQILQIGRAWLKTDIEKKASDIACDILNGLSSDSKAQLCVFDHLEDIFIDVSEDIYVRIGIDIEEKEIWIWLYRTINGLQGLRIMEGEFDISSFWKEMDLVRKNDPNHDTTKFYSDVYDV